MPSYPGMDDVTVLPLVALDVSQTMEMNGVEGTSPQRMSRWLTPGILQSPPQFLVAAS